MKSTGLRFSTRSFLVSVATFGALGGLLGCPVINEQHCAFNGTSATQCAEGLMCSMCEISNNGCVAASAMLGDCLFVVSSGTTDGTDTTASEPTIPTTTPDVTTDTTAPVDTETSTSEAVDTSSTSPDVTTETEPMTETTVVLPDCTSDDQCQEEAPYCTPEQTCVTCEEVDCAARDPEKPVCNGTLCVGCVNNNDCGGNKPYCDPMTATCQPCTIHEQCPDTACNIETNECFPKENVVYVQNTNNMAVDIQCSSAANHPGTDPKKPFCRLNGALASAKPGKPLTIKVKQGEQPQSQSNPVPPGVVVAIVRRDGSPVNLPRDSTDPALTVPATSLVYVDQISFFNTTLGLSTQLILCDGGTLWLERSIVYYGKVGVVGRQCNLHVRRSVVFQNQNGGIDVTETGMDTKSELWLENSYVTDNGPVFGVRASNNSFLNILYSTIAGNSQGVQVPAVACSQAPLANLHLRNSLIAVGSGIFTNCNWADMAEQATNVTATAVTLDDLEAMDISDFHSQGIVRAKEDGELAGKAVWLPGDTRHDYASLDVRPKPGPSADYAGADVP